MIKFIFALLFCSFSGFAATKSSALAGSTAVSNISSLPSQDSSPSTSTIAVLQTNLAVLSKGGGFMSFEFAKVPQVSLGFSLYNLMEKEKNKVTTTNRYGIGGTYYMHGPLAQKTVFAGASLYFGQQSTRDLLKENIENLNGIGLKAGGHLTIAQNVLVDVGILMTGFSGNFTGEPLLGLGFTF